MNSLDLKNDLLAALQKQGGGSSDFDLNPNIKLSNRTLRDAAVLIAITDDARVLLTKRSAHLKHHPGQIAFPGGKVDPTDNGVEDAALREAEEEIALPRNQVEVLGKLPSHETVTNYSVSPVVARVHGQFQSKVETGEVDELFEVPLAYLTNPNHFQIEYRYWQGIQRKYYIVPYGPYYIWGATARILRGLADRMAT